MDLRSSRMQQRLNAERAAASWPALWLSWLLGRTHSGAAGADGWLLLAVIGRLKAVGHVACGAVGDGRDLRFAIKCLDIDRSGLCLRATRLRAARCPRFRARLTLGGTPCPCERSARCAGASS